MKSSLTTNAPLHGNVAPGFEAVQTAFARNFTERGELGGACFTIEFPPNETA